MRNCEKQASQDLINIDQTQIPFQVNLRTLFLQLQQNKVNNKKKPDSKNKFQWSQQNIKVQETKQDKKLQHIIAKFRNRTYFKNNQQKSQIKHIQTQEKIAIKPSMPKMNSYNHKIYVLPQLNKFNVTLLKYNKQYMPLKSAYGSFKKNSNCHKMIRKSQNKKGINLQIQNSEQIQKNRYLIQRKKKYNGQIKISTFIDLNTKKHNLIHSFNQSNQQEIKNSESCIQF